MAYFRTREGRGRQARALIIACALSLAAIGVGPTGHSTASAAGVSEKCDGRCEDVAFVRATAPKSDGDMRERISAHTTEPMPNRAMSDDACHGSAMDRQLT